jgi:hypothetical protein
VDAALQRRDGDRRVQERRRRHADGVQALGRQQVLPAVDLPLDAEAGGDLRAGGDLQRGDPGDLDAGQGAVGHQVLLARPPHADDGDAQRVVWSHLRLAPPRTSPPRNRAPW